MSTLSYKDAGVDIDEGNRFVENIKPFVKSTFNKHVLGNIGSFAGGFALPEGYKQPILFGATDGVGTKLKLAIDAKKFDTVGIDLVAMCVNDLICNFADPLFFLDYYATAELKVEEATQVVEGIAKGCVLSEAALIGGETAEMPGMYAKGDFDLAGFAVGVAEKAELEMPREMKEGDVLIALASSGVHSNGYSLVRKLFFEKLHHKFDDDFGGRKLIDVLLEPTNIYVKTYKIIKNDIKALAHITGGGITENLPRVLPENLTAIVEKNTIRHLEVFNYMRDYVAEDELYRTFNMGVGMVVVCDKAKVDEVCAKSGGYVIGVLKSGEKKVELV